jgi:hypothetical protein
VGVSCCCCFGGGGGGGAPAGGPVGNTWKGMPIAAAPIDGAGGSCVPFGWASGEGRGLFVTPSEHAFWLTRLAMRGDLICDKSMPPGVYVNGFLSFVIIAF